jgi:hypothetical protein
MLPQNRKTIENRLGAALKARRDSYLAARRQRGLREIVALATTAVRVARAALPEAADELQAFADRLVAETDVPAVQHDRWAVARESAALRANGVQPHRIARALVSVGFCRAGATEAATRRACLARLRVEEGRFRRATGA